MIQEEDWIQVPTYSNDISYNGEEKEDLFSNLASLLNHITAGLYEDTAYARAFWLLGTGCLITEPFLVQYTRDDRLYIVQIIIFAISTTLFVYQTIGLLFATKPWEITTKQLTKRPWLMRWNKHKTLYASMENVFRGICLYFGSIVFKHKYILYEFVFVIIGWVSIITQHRGVAIIRIFRIFRILWYYDIKAMRPLLLAQDEKIFNIVIPKDSTVILAMKNTIVSLKNLGKEMFTFTGRGGMLLILIFFYTGYLFAIMFSIDAEDLTIPVSAGGKGITACAGLLECWYTMCRYSFWDSTGFNYMYALYDNHKLMYFGSIIYLMVASLGILFGILAIFRAPFKEDPNSIQEDAEFLTHMQLDRLQGVLENRATAIEHLQLQIQLFAARGGVQ